ncbi:MAG TPA: glycosyltransferase [Bacilli bacterium]|nr:glycosyltransferase [Bacilli bacterium]
MANLVSVIFPVKNEGKHIKNTIDSLRKCKTNHQYEMIVVDDASNDGCCDYLRENKEDDVTLVSVGGVGAAMARNVGADHAKGDYYIFCDAHLFFEDYWIDRLLEPIENGFADATNPGIGDVANPSNVGYGYSWTSTLEPRWNTGKRELFLSPHLAGGCLAISKKAFDDIGGFERGFKVWGREDEEISLKLWLFGYKCAVVPSVKVLHVFRSDSPPFVITWDQVNYNLMRMAYSHFNEERIEKCKKIIKHSKPEKIVSDVLQSNVLEQRKAYFAKRKYDDDWYMKKFNIPF